MPARRSLLLLSALVFASACSSGEQEPCSSVTCSGCCDAQGVCQPGFAANACGAHGASCAACGSQVCVSGACTGNTSSWDGGIDRNDGGLEGNTLAGELAFVPRTARVGYHGLADGGWSLSYVSVVLADRDVDLCAGLSWDDLEVVGINVGMPSPGDAVVTPGTYSVDNQSPTSPEGGVQVLRASIRSGGILHVLDRSIGIVRLTDVDTTRVRGTFAVAFALDGGVTSLSGTFDALACEP